MTITDRPGSHMCPRCGTSYAAAATPEAMCPHCLFGVADSPGLLPAGTRLGRYEVLSSLGQGGMGEVYRARDARLGRMVAIKVLPSDVGADVKWRLRLEREAQLISQLNHPHICALFDVGEENGIVFLVMEYLEGETLLDRLRRGPLPIDQVLQCAVEIADALDEAHRHGVVHRDLKPNNIMLTASGAKLLDFGLAKLHPAHLADRPSGMPLVPPDPAPSGERTLVGTIRYMAPEQLEGREADPRSDLFALGLVIYEMTAGRPAFAAESDASLMVALLSSRPPRVSTLREVPAALEQLIDTCLTKNPDDRWQTAKDILLQLRWMSQQTAAGGGALGTSRRPRASALPWTAAGVATAAALAAVVVAQSRRPNPDVIRFSLTPPARSAFATLSPDGRRVAWLAQDRGDTRLFVQTLDSLTAAALDGTEGAQAPFWSPDSGSVGFFADGALKRVAVSGGPAVTIAAAPFGLGGAWNRDGTIVFAADRAGGLARVRIGDGRVEAATAVNRDGGETSHRWPAFLPDGRHFLYLALGKGRESGVLRVGALDAAGGAAIGQADSGAVYTPPGFLLFTLKGTLMAQRFDARALQPRGDPFPIAKNAAQDLIDRSNRFSASETGVLVYHSLMLPESRLVWFDRAGRWIGAVVAPGLYGDPSMSSDSTSAAFAKFDADKQTSDIWRLDLVHGGLSRITAANATALRPLWSPSGDHIVFTLKRNQAQEMFRIAASGGPERLLQRSVTNQTACDWRSDGKFILYEDSDPTTKSDLWMMPQDGTHAPVPYLRTTFNETRGRLSPDGRWVSYTSDESGTSDVFVQTFPISGRKWQVSVRGGTQAIWRRDGQEIFYLAPDRRLMSVPVVAAGARLAFGPATPIFQVPDGATWDTRFTYAVSADGQRFLVNVGTKEGPIQFLSATIVVNWPASLQTGG